MRHKNAQTNCQCVSSQFIASKTQETHSRGNIGFTFLLTDTCLERLWLNCSVSVIIIWHYSTIFLHFHSVAWVMPQGWDFGVPWGLQFFFLKFNQIRCASYLHEWHMQLHTFLGPRPLGLGEGPKGQIWYHMTKTAWDALSGVTKTGWDVLYVVANLCGMFCPGCQKMAWDVCLKMFCPAPSECTCPSQPSHRVQTYIAPFKWTAHTPNLVGFRPDV